MARARGANAILALAYAGSYGAVPATGFKKLPFVTCDLGDAQGLIESDVLGNGREPQTPGQDVINNEGTAQVPVDLRAFGYWLKLLFGAPTTAAGIAATGSLTFDAQPAEDSTITINGTEFTFTASPASGTDIAIGATLAATVQNAVRALNASADSDVAEASYQANLDLTAILVTHATPGAGGNAFTLAAGSSPDSNATVSAATLAGGADTGRYRHTFVSGALALPDAAIEIGHPDVPTFAVNYGVMANTLAIALQRSGHLNATLGLIAQGERAPTTSTATDSPSDIPLERFSQFTGAIYRDAVPLAEVVSANLAFSNGLDKVEVIREDGRIAGADPGMMSGTGNLVTRFRDRVLHDLAANGVPVELVFGWKIGTKGRLTFTYHRAHLPRPKTPITGPGGIQASFDYQASEDPALQRLLTVVLENDVASYA